MASINLFEHLLTNFPGAKDACLPIALTTDGVLIYEGAPYPDIDQTVYLTPYCPMGSVYIYDLNRLFENNIHVVTASTEAWKDIYTKHSGYAYSIPVFMSIMAFALIMTVSMAVLMSVSRHSRFPLFIRFSVFSGTAETVVIFAIMMQYLRVRHADGGNAVSLTVQELVTRSHRIASYVATSFLQFCLVIVAEQFFRRGLERKAIVSCGALLVVSSVALSGISNFSPIEHTMLTAFHYLVELSSYFLFTICVAICAIESFQAAFSGELACLTILTICTTCLPPALYVADFYGWWHARMIDQLCPFTVVMCVVITWYWIQKVHDMEQSLAENHQLGRRVVEFGNGQLGESKKVVNGPANPKYFWANGMPLD